MPESGPPRTLTTKLARSFLACSKEAAIYGLCIRANVETNLAKDVCKEQFDKFKQCAVKAIKQSK